MSSGRSRKIESSKKLRTKKNKKGTRTEEAQQSMNDPAEAEDEKEIPPPKKKGTRTKKGLPCSVYTFGFGKDHNTDALKDIAEAGGGGYYFIEEEDSIAESFSDCLGGLLSVVAQNIRLEITSCNGTKLPAKDGVFEIGDIQSEEQKDNLVEVAVPKSADNQHVIAHLNLSYYNVLTKTQQEITKEVVLARQKGLKKLKANREVLQQKMRVKVFKALADANKDADRGKMEVGRKKLASVLSELKECAVAKEEVVVGLIEDIDEAIESMANKRAYASGGKHKMNNMAMEHKCQRNMRSKKGKYQCSKKKAMITSYQKYK
eukprot:TRINITY_DN2131_c0_g1_i1.p1 TRINITY_DN2131_c0_g1~~TRINITY_DN2131_c0_g1_i1.p1  ORF type:complete len:318 (+),score=77.55 TRINITY_DN2131_c0_g1_i1:252-1205(+)